MFVFRSHSVTWKIFCTNEALRSATKQFGFGGTDLVRCLQTFAAFICHPTDYATLAATVVDSGSGRFVVENGAILGRRVVQSTLATAGTVILGDYSHLIVAMFGGTDLIVDPYSSATSATVKITTHNFADVGVRHPVAFCKITLTA